MLGIRRSDGRIGSATPLTKQGPEERYGKNQQQEDADGRKNRFGARGAGRREHQPVGILLLDNGTVGCSLENPRPASLVPDEDRDGRKGSTDGKLDGHRSSPVSRSADVLRVNGPGAGRFRKTCGVMAGESVFRLWRTDGDPALP
jgi:hypothetical protein